MLLEKHSFEDGIGGWALWEMQESEAELIHLCPIHTKPCPFRGEKRRLEYYSIRALLAEVLGPDKLIDYYPSGRPLLVDGSFQISISHTRGIVALAWHPVCRVGIDVEQKSDRVSKVISKFVSIKESLQIQSFVGSDVSVPALYHLFLWSAKETVYKLIDRTAVDFLSDIVIDIDSPLDKEGSYWSRSLFYDDENAEMSRLLDCSIHYCFYPSFVLTYSKAE